MGVRHAFLSPGPDQDHNQQDIISLLHCQTVYLPSPPTDSNQSCFVMAKSQEPPQQSQAIYTDLFSLSTSSLVLSRRRTRPSSPFSNKVVSVATPEPPPQNRHNFSFYKMPPAQACPSTTKKIRPDPCPIRNRSWHSASSEFPELLSHRGLQLFLSRII